MPTTRSARCMCAAVELVLHDTSDEYGACHCPMCQRWTGSAFFGVSARVEVRAGSEAVRRIQSSDWAERAWCDRCGTGLWYRMTRGTRQGHFDVPLGILDDPAGLVFTREFFHDQRLGCFEPGERKTLSAARVRRLLRRL